MTKGSVVFAALGVSLFALLLGFGLPYFLLPIIHVGSGFTAKTICSELFVAGRSIEDIQQNELRHNLPTFLPFRWTVHQDGSDSKGVGWRGVEVDLLSIASSRRKAVFLGPNLGCVLLPPEQAEVPQQLAHLQPPRKSLGGTKLSRIFDSQIEQLRNVESKINQLSKRSQLDPLPWPTGNQIDSHLQEAAMDGVDMQRLNLTIDDHFRNHSLNARALVVVHKGQIVAERYAADYSLDPHSCSFHNETQNLAWSVTKSLLNAIVGMRVRDGHMSLDEQLIEKDDSRSPPDQTFSNITIRELLQMSSGLFFDERYGILDDPSRMLFSSFSCSSFARSRAKEGHQQDGGERRKNWNYSSGCSNILSSRVRSSFPDLESYLRYPFEQFSRIGMTRTSLEVDASGSFVSSSFSYLSGRDFARFGLLYLNDGVWENGERILPEGWVDFTKSPVEGSNGFYGAHFWLGGSAQSAPDPRIRWMKDLPSDAFFASGFEEKVILVIPSRSLVIARLGWTPASLGWDRMASLYGPIIASMPIV